MQGPYFDNPNRFPKNAPGPFYTTGTRNRSSGVETWCSDCLWCGAPEAEAPELLAPLSDFNSDTYFVRQPETQEETEKAIQSALVCCVAAVRYAGVDSDIIRRLGNDPLLCDHIFRSSEKLECVLDAKGRLLPFARAMVDEQRPAAILSHTRIAPRRFRISLSTMMFWVFPFIGVSFLILTAFPDVDDAWDTLPMFHWIRLSAIAILGALLIVLFRENQRALRLRDPRPASRR